MSDTKKPSANHTPLHDGLGIVLIIVGALLGVAAVMYIKKGAIDNPTTFTAVMSWLVEAVGPPAILWLCLGLLFVGARMFLYGGERGSIRDPIGFVATALGLSILMGAFSKAFGGSFGFAIGGSMSEVGTTAAGVALGLASLLIPAWVIWLRVAPPALVAKANALIGEAPASEAEAGAFMRKTGRPASSLKQPTEDPSGVTSAEADALLPDPERAEILDALRSANRNSATTVNHAPSPYPADVRREGGIPDGARPIEATNEPRKASPAANPVAANLRPSSAPAPREVPASGGGSAGGTGAVRNWSAAKPVPSQVRADADLAPTKNAGSPVAAARSASAPELKVPAVEAKPLPTPVIVPPAPQAGGAALAARAVPIPIASGVGVVGAPTWENDEPDLELEPEVAELAKSSEPLVVDAYGTPLELVAALRGEAVAAPKPVTPAAEAELESDGDDDLEDIEPWAADVQLDADADEAEDEHDVVRPAQALEAETEDDFEEADEVEQIPVSPAGAHVAGDFENEDPDSETDLEQAEAEVPVAAVNSPSNPEVTDRSEREVELQPVQNSLFDAEPLSASTPQAPLVVAKSPARERTVVLDPRPAPVAQTEAPEAGDDLVYRCGMLFLAQKRVAVSMLQREFGLDFKQATAVLDQLQEQGLIGPYLGGQRRDILLSAEEWRARVGAAS